MHTEIKSGTHTILVSTSIYPDTPSCNGVMITCGPFIFSPPLGETKTLKALIAALIEADQELDAAVEARKKDGVMA